MRLFLHFFMLPLEICSIKFLETIKTTTANEIKSTRKRIEKKNMLKMSAVATNAFVIPMSNVFLFHLLFCRQTSERKLMNRLKWSGKYEELLLSAERNEEVKRNFSRKIPFLNIDFVCWKLWREDDLKPPLKTIKIL